MNPLAIAVATLVLRAVGLAAPPQNEIATKHTPPNLVAQIFATPALARSAAMIAPAEHRLQVLISEIVEDDDRPTLRRHGSRVDAEYFYPASTIKLAAAIAACQELQRLAATIDDGVGLNTPIELLPEFDGESLETTDPTNVEGGTITVGHEIRKLFIVSNNTAYNRLYDFVGQDTLNTAMWDAGLTSARLSHRLSIRRTTEQNRVTRAVKLNAAAGTIKRPSARSDLDLTVRDVAGIEVGERYISHGATIQQPMDFSAKNHVSLVDLQDMLVKVTRPDIDLGTPGFGLTEAHREHLLAAMRELPRESTNPIYDPAKYPDDWVKFLLPGLDRVAPRGTFTIYNKVGLAYGFMIENAYIVHEPSDRAMFVTAAIYANPNATLNDNTYGYESTSLPFFADLGEAVGRHLIAE